MFDAEPTAMAGEYKGAQVLKEYKPRTKLERLRDAKVGLESKLAEINHAIEILESNPELTKMIDALEKVNI